MIVVCPKCSSKVDLGAPKTPGSGNRCPKCGTALTVRKPSPAYEKSALAVGQSPSTNPRYDGSRPAPQFELETVAAPESANSNSSSMEEMTRVLAGLLDQNSRSKAEILNVRPAWNPRKALVCAAETHREPIARQLARDGYQVFVAQDTGQAVDRMRQNQLDVVLLDPEFDSEEQGSAFVIREVNILRPVQRRRIFFVMLSPMLRTMEAHAAFLHNVNAIVNLKDINDVANILEHAIREYNELYKEFNVALALTAL